MTDAEDNSFQEKRRQVGTLMLWLGGLMALLIAVDRSGFAGSVFPGFWYRSRSMHLLICAAFFAAGVFVYRYQDSPEDSDTPEESHGGRGSARFDRVRFFTRANCPLCDEAMEVLEEFGDAMPEIEFIDIAQDAQLEEQHGEWIPVIEIDGRIRFRGHVDRTLLQRLVDARRRGQPASDDEVSA